MSVRVGDLVETPEGYRGIVERKRRQEPPKGGPYVKKLVGVVKVGEEEYRELLEEGLKWYVLVRLIEPDRSPHGASVAGTSQEYGEQVLRLVES